jgi:hypothetical protein
VATPESKVKAAVNRVLAKYKNYKHMPVPYGYGASTLDYLICVNGWFLAIETKARGKKPTERQEKIIKDILDAGGTVLVIDGTDDTDTLEDLKEFMKKALADAARSRVPQT